MSGFYLHDCTMGVWKGETRTPEELAADLVKAMPEELAGVFERLNLLWSGHVTFS